MVKYNSMIQPNYLTINEEDYFQVFAFENVVNKDDGSTYPSRIVSNWSITYDIIEASL